MIPVEGNPNLFRDENTGAIVNCDASSYQQYLISKQRKSLEKKEIKDLKSEISEIKLLLKQLMNQNGWSNYFQKCCKIIWIWKIS